MAPFDLSGKRVVIVGGTSGLGLSAARAFVQAGARLVLVGRNPDHVEAVRKEFGDPVRALAGDASRPEIAEHAIALAAADWGGLDGLYHVAGGSGRSLGDGPLHELTDEGWHSTLQWNLSSLMFSNRAAIRQFLAQKTGGSILNMSSVLGWSPSPRHFATHAYAAAKAAAIGFTKAIASYYASKDIRCNILAPALVETAMARRAAGDEQILHFVHTKQPLDGGRIGQPTDLDGAALYFMSDASKFTTGQVLAVDGGWCLSEGQFAS